MNNLNEENIITAAEPKCF